MNRIEVFAPAKINLAFSVRGIRDDGFHEVETIMQSLALEDRIVISKQSAGIRIRSNCSSIPLNSNNLAYQAADILKKKYKITAGVDIFIEKNIPIAAGLAGGSSDAAAVLRGMRTLFNLELTDKMLENIAARIGCDVPFCVQGGTVYATGRGDVLNHLPDIDKHYVVLVRPPVAVSTAGIFRKYDELKRDYEGSENVLEALKKDLEKTGKISLHRGWFNDLQPVTGGIIEDIGKIISKLREFNVQLVLMSGSGPTVFAIVKDFERAGMIRDRWPREQDLVICTSTAVRKKH